MEFRHTKCYGKIDTKKRHCKGCGKNWSPVGFVIATDIRPVKQVVKVKPRQKLTAQSFASHLPKWPRWLRVLTVTILLVLVVTLIIWLRSR